MTLRNYTNNALPIALTADVTSSETVLPVTTTTNWPAAPFIAAIDRETSIQEVVLVTSIQANSLAVIRGYDGSPAYDHSASAPVEHVAAAIEYREANEHVNDGTKHFATYETNALPTTGVIPGQVVYDTSVGYHKFWAGSYWFPLPGTLIAHAEITSNRSPQDGDGPSGYGYTPAGCTWTFTMPQVPTGHRVKLEWNCRNLWYDRGDRREVIRVELRRNSNNAILCAKDVVSESWGGDTRNHGIYVVGWMDNGDIPAGTETVKLVMWCDDGGIGFQAGPTHPATFAATVT